MAFFSLAGVVLAVTGAEALYADMGHFGRKAITRAWLFVVLPALPLNYLGQGALLLADETAVSAPFFLLDPGLGAVADGAAGDRRDRHRIASGDHRSILGRRRRPSSSGICRGCAWCTRRRRPRPDLHAMDQRHADGGGPDPGVRVPQFGVAGICLRDGGDRNDHHHDAAVPLHRPHEMAGAAVADRHWRRRTAGLSICCFWPRT